MKITTRKYITDKLGNVIKISDSVFGDCDYEYDYRGFLTKETGITYQYDDNGNILKVGNKTFEYDSAIKDRLIKANGQTLSYHPTGNLSTWKNWTYQFEGKYLKQINHNIFYEYDMLGLRISKTINNQKTTYLYDGNLLLTEITPTYRNDFLYDENGILYGFIHDYSTKYFYVRDVFQNILGIVDENGNLVVKYAYTAYGTLKSISGSLATTIGQYNPFRFKGYYYDQESELFYCNGRYYSSELCRFIQPADVSSLNLYSNNEMNIFSYGKNNPVTYFYSSFESYIMLFGKGHQGNMRSSKYVYWTTEELLARLKELSKKGHLTAEEKKEKKEIETELKARGERNRAKRQGYTHSHFSLLPATSTFSYIPSIGGFYSNFESIPNFNSNVDEETLVITGGSLVVAGLITYVITNDATGFGVADDWALLVLIPLFILLEGES